MKFCRITQFALLALLSGWLGNALAEGQVLFETEVRLVEVPVTVQDGKRRYVAGLTQDQFGVYEGGQRQPIVAFEADSSGFSCVLLIDTTGSMQKTLAVLKRSILRFIDELRPSDSVAVYAFSTQLELVQPLTTDKDAAKRAVLRTRAAGSTALFDSVFRVANDLHAVTGKKALLVFTDGDDNSSVLNAQSAVRRARTVGMPVFVAAQGQALDSKPLLNQLWSLARSTGGLAFEIRKSKDAEKAFRAIVQDLKFGYLLAFRPPDGPINDWRAIRVTVSGVKRAKVRAKTGYLPR